MINAVPAGSSRDQTTRATGLAILAALAIAALFFVVNYFFYNWLSPMFERGSSQTGWGILQRLYLILPCAAAALWKPRALGFQVGRIAQHWKMLLIMLVCNVAIIGAYKLIAGGTPYSGLDMLVNEVITVPLVEEVFWRGIVFAVLYAILRRAHAEAPAALLAGIIGGAAFGLLHANNALFGYPPAFVLLQTLNATVWGVMYGVARAKTGSLYPSIVMHGAMNLAVVLI